MKSLLAFVKKEITDQVRSGRLMLLGIIFVLIGIMNPAVAKLTPWMLEMMSDSLANSGMIITLTNVSAMDSWVQFFKNMPIGLIAFVLIQSSIFTKEYGSGSTLVLSLTKGLERFKVVVAKAGILLTFWTVGYWLSVGITYGYNAYFWDNSVAQNLVFSVVCWWLFGMFVISLMILLSTIANSNTGVLAGTGGVVVVAYLIELVPKVGKYLPTYLADGTSLIYGISEIKTYIASLVITALISIMCLGLSIPVFNKKQL